jgi:flagellar motor switch protein FliM
MSPDSEPPNPSGDASNAEVEQLLASVAKHEADTAMLAKNPVPPPPKDAVQPYDFRNPMLLSPRELRKLRSHQQEFVSSLAARLSQHLRLEFILKLTGLQTISYQNLVDSWASPSHLALFKIEPLRGVSILEIPPRLGSCIVDRLMGGPGKVPAAPQEMSEIEKALLEQIVQLILAEWCGQWSRLRELKPVLLGYESNGRFVQTAPPETTMLLLSMEAGIGEFVEKIQIGFPYSALEPLIRKLSQGAAEAAMDAAIQPGARTAPKWNPSFDNVDLPVTAEWHGLEMTAREMLALKVGDVLRIDPQSVQQVTVRLAEVPKFTGRPGMLSGNWAVELTQVIKD